MGPVRYWPPRSSPGQAQHMLSCPFEIPSAKQLFATLTQDITGTFSGSPHRASHWQNRKLKNGELHGNAVGRTDGNQRKAPLRIRWMPFALQRVSRDSQAEEAAPDELKEIREVADFVRVLQRKLTTPVRTLDGREVVVIVNDRLPEMELILRNAFKFAPAGTPVIVTDTEAFSPENVFSRVQLRSPDGETLHFVVFGYGRYGQLPLDTAFLDRALVRIPKADDIRAFLEYRANEAEGSSNASDSPPVAGGRDTKLKDGLHAEAKPEAHSAAIRRDVTSSSPGSNFFVLNPFTDLLLRFNYTEVDSVSKYAAGLTEELRNIRITFQYRNRTRRAALVLLTDLPEAENAFPSGLVKLNMVVQATIAVSMIIAFLACLCMCRMMYLLKSR